MSGLVTPWHCHKSMWSQHCHTLAHLINCLFMPRTFVTLVNIICHNSIVAITLDRHKRHQWNMLPCASLHFTATVNRHYVIWSQALSQQLQYPRGGVKCKYCILSESRWVPVSWDNTIGNDAACSTLEISQIGETQSLLFHLIKPRMKIVHFSDSEGSVQTESQKNWCCTAQAPFSCSPTTAFFLSSLASCF